MTNALQAVVTKPVSAGVMADNLDMCHLDLEIDTGHTLRLLFPFMLGPHIMGFLSAGQNKAVEEERTKRGLPAVVPVMVKTVERYEYSSDSVQQVAVLRTHCHDGSSLNIPIGKQDLPNVIQGLQKTLRDLEQTAPGIKH